MLQPDDCVCYIGGKYPGCTMFQGVYYQGSEAIGGQQGVRFMCSMNYQSPTQGANTQQGFGLTPTVVVEGNNQAQAYPTHQYCQQYVQNYQGNQMYSQGQTVGCQGESCDYPSGGGYSVASPVEGPSCVGTGGYCYPVSYSQPQGVVSCNQSQMYYTVQTPQSTPTQATGQQGFVQYSGQQGTTYQTNTSPPSQNSTVTHSVHQLDNVATQAMNNMNSVNTATPQQHYTTGGVQPGMAAVTPSPGGQFVTSFPSSHQMMTHAPHYHQPQAFTSPLRPVTPTVVPMPGVHGQTTPMGQTFHTVYRPNMQMPMQIYPQAAQQGQQPLMMAAASINKPIHHGSGQQSSHVTVSAKGLQCDGKLDSEGGENGDVVSVQATESLTGFRPLHLNQGKINFLSQCLPQD